MPETVKVRLIGNGVVETREVDIRTGLLGAIVRPVVEAGHAR